MSMSEQQDLIVTKRTLLERLEDICAQVDHLLRTAETEDAISRLAIIAKDLAVLRLMTVTPGAGDQRQHIRLPQSIASYCRLEHAELDCTISDISVGGALIQTDDPLPLNEDMALEIPAAGSIRGRVRNSSHAGYHVEFIDTSEDQVIALLDSMKATLWR